MTIPTTPAPTVAPRAGMNSEYPIVWCPPYQWLFHTVNPSRRNISMRKICAGQSAPRHPAARTTTATATATTGGSHRIAATTASFDHRPPAGGAPTVVCIDRTLTGPPAPTDLG
ncbi:hypothetical protein [Actinomarinicola tropica]|uniref:Uncharacterized protein n=1 Tax=Actinomarinicola tropica TaxID=2789776 RepID=A0A5Q2RJT2_9ACTN|nr:hypothetical protein [Actinomarinicola tropica]QGG95754.1 hypothetical protein GH723_11975 [Actinomarinicola tropica]